MVLPLSSVPPRESAFSESSETPSCTWALTMKRTKESASQPNTASGEPLGHPARRDALALGRRRFGLVALGPAQPALE